MAMKDSVNGVSLTPMRWHDREFRKVIANWDSTMQYDDPANNANGRFLSFADSKVKFKAEKKKFKFELVKPIESQETCEKALFKHGSMGFRF
jgi:hypothetical protein